MRVQLREAALRWTPSTPASRSTKTSPSSRSRLGTFSKEAVVTTSDTGQERRRAHVVRWPVWPSFRREVARQIRRAGVADLGLGRCAFSVVMRYTRKVNVDDIGACIGPQTSAVASQVVEDVSWLDEGDQLPQQGVDGAIEQPQSQIAEVHREIDIFGTQHIEKNEPAPSTLG